LATVDLDNRLLAVPLSGDLALLQASIREVGLLAPVWLRADPQGRWQVITGWKRLVAVARLGWERVPARTLPAGTPESHCLLLHLYDNALSRGFHPLEQALLAARLIKHWDRATVVARFLPYLGLPPSQVHLDRLLSLAALEGPFQELASQGRLALTAAHLLAPWDLEDRTAAWPFLSGLPLSQSKQEEFLEAVDLLARREGSTRREIFSRPELRQFLAETGGTPQERAEALRGLLKRRVSPRLAGAQEAWQKALSRLGLRQHPRLRLKAPPAFEGPDFHLEIKFRDASELAGLLDEMKRLLSRDDFAHLAKL
jgi:ParB-like chromosome segregation protein Spo0J